ncbi:hypothetical protein ACA910_000526 [Epithemia clementina (nom. ined.)]
MDQNVPTVGTAPHAGATGSGGGGGVGRVGAVKVAAEAAAAELVANDEESKDEAAEEPDVSVPRVLLNSPTKRRSNNNFQQLKCQKIMMQAAMANFTRTAAKAESKESVCNQLT